MITFNFLRAAFPEWADRFISKIKIGKRGCWLWQASLDGKGYSFFRCRGSMRRAHKFLYESIFGSINYPERELDHLCRVRRCVNPAHVEPVTQKENTRRGNGPAAKCARMVRCKHGHAFSVENTYLSPSGKRRCRKCMRQCNAATYFRSTEGVVKSRRPTKWGHLLESL